MYALPRRVLVRSAVAAAAACAVAVPAYSTSAATTSAATSAATTSAAPAAAFSTARSSSSCGASFTLAAKRHAATKSHQLIGVRAGRHTCYDRLVLDFRGPVNGYYIRYVKQVHEDASGKVVPLAGRSKLQITVVAPAYDVNGKPTYRPADPWHLVKVRGFQSFRQVAWAGTYEGYTTLGVGVRRALPFRVLVLAGPGRHGRIVLDVAHNR